MLIYIIGSIAIHLIFVNNLTGILNNKSYIAIHVRMLIYIIDSITIHLIFVKNLTSILINKSYMYHRSLLYAC